MKLRTYWLLGTLITCSFPLGALFFNFAVESNHVSEHELVLESHILSSVSTNLKEQIMQAEKLISLSADYLGETGTQDTAALSTYLKNFYNTCNEFLNVHYDNLEGKAIAFYPPKNVNGQDNVGQDHTNRKHWTNMRANSAAHISNVFRGVGATSKIIANVTAGAFDAHGHLVGYAVSALDLDFLARRVSQFAVPKGYRLIISDSSGIAVYTDAGAPESLTPTFDKTDLTKARRGDQGERIFLTQDGKKYPGRLVYISEVGWYVGLFQMQPANNSFFVGGVKFLLITTLLTILLAILISYLFGHPVKLAYDRFKLLAGKNQALCRPENLITFPEEFGELQTVLSQAFSKLDEAMPSTEKEKQSQRPLIMKILELRNFNQSLLEIFAENGIGIALFNDYAQVQQFNDLFEKITGYSLNLGDKMDRVLADEFTEGGILFTGVSKSIIYTFKKSGVRAKCSIFPVSGQDPALYILLVQKAPEPQGPKES